MYREQSGPLHWWQTRWFVLAMALAAAVPLLWPTIPPLVDLPGHMGRYRVQIDHGLYPWLGDWYDFNWALIGNLGIDLIVEILAPIVGLELAVKLIVIAIPVLTVTGLLWIAREVHGRIPATALFALPIAYSFPLHFGFVNFALSMALALNAFAWWLRLARQGRLAFRAIVFVPLSCALWVCHTFGWGMLGVMAFSAEMVRQHDAGHGWVKGWARAIPHCLPLALPAPLMLLWRSGEHVTGGTGDWFNWRAKFIWLIAVLRDRWMAYDLFSAAIMYFVALKGVRDDVIHYSRNLGLSALLLLAVFLLLPRIVFGSAYADMRLAPYVIGVAVIALRPRDGLSMRGAARLAAVGLALFLGRMGATAASFELYDREYGRQLAALDHVPLGARLVTFIGRSCLDDWAASRLEHLPGIALERRLAYSNDQWSMAGGQLLTTRYAVAGGFSHDPSEIVTHTYCHGQFWRPIVLSLARLPRAAFDYVWLVSPPAYDPRYIAGLVPIWRSGTSVLFRIDHDAPGPAISDAELRRVGGMPFYGLPRRLKGVKSAR